MMLVCIREKQRHVGSAESAEPWINSLYSEVARFEQTRLFRVAGSVEGRRFVNIKRRAQFEPILPMQSYQRLWLAGRLLRPDVLCAPSLECRSGQRHISGRLTDTIAITASR